MSQVCRTCLEEISYTDYLSLNDKSNKIRNELAACVPELDLNLIPDATMCIYCANALHAAYNFKQKCLQTEEKIRSHKEDRKWLDLEHIKQEPELDEKYDIVHGVGIGMEVIFIRDDDIASEDENLIDKHQLADEPVNSFLELENDYESSSKMILGGFAGALRFPQNNSLKSNGKTHSIKEKKLEVIKKETKSSYSSSYNSSSGSTRSRRLANGVTTHNGQKDLKCDLCSYTTTRENLLTLHIKTHPTAKPYRCSKCTYQTSYRQCLQNHLKNCNPSNLNSSPKKKESFKCSQCTFSALQGEALQEHMQIHSTGKLKCTKCSYEVANLSTFKRHLSTHTAAKLHKCLQCDYQCYDASVLNKHMSNHKENKSFKCKHCSYSTEYSGALANHILIHTGEKPFACSHCNYKAIQKGNLKNHMKHHTNKGLHKCTKCSYSAASSSNLQKHMKFHN